MLQDYLFKDPSSFDELVLTDDDHKAIRASQDGRALQAILKFCIARVIDVENQLFEAEECLSEAQVEGVVQARKAYKAVANMILYPSIDEEEPENE